MRIKTSGEAFGVFLIFLVVLSGFATVVPVAAEDAVEVKFRGILIGIDAGLNQYFVLVREVIVNSPTGLRRGRIASVTASEVGQVDVRYGDKVEVYGYDRTASCERNTRPDLPPVWYCVSLERPDHYLRVLKLHSKITIAVSPASVKLGRATRIHGRISPRHAGVEVTVYYSTDGGATWTSFQTLTTNPLGFYAYTWTAPEKGIYLFKATWPGDHDHESAESRTMRLKVR
jgi:hypothetical protein